MTPLRKTALTAGVFYLLSFISIPTLALYGGLRDPNYIVIPGSGTGATWGAILEMIVALAGIGTAVVLYPVVRRQGEARALGFAGIRVLEAATIVSGIVVVMSMVSLHQDGAGPQALSTGKVMVAMHNWTFLTRTGPPAGRERRAAGIPALPIPPRAADPPRAGIHRSAAACHLIHRHTVRFLDPGVPGVRPADHPGRRLGVLARRLPDRQRLQALIDHHGNRDDHHPARRPRPRRVGAEHITAQITSSRTGVAREP